MKKYILKSLFVSVLCMLAASCQDTEIVETLEASQAQIVFPIALDSPSARSRSSWDGYTGLGNGNEYDSHIDFNQFIVQIEANGKTYPVTSIIKLEGGNKFVGIVDEEIKSETLQNAKISIFANMGKESVAETFSQDAENIPMWGVKTVSKLEFAPGKREEVSDPVFMLRAMAKMEVALTPECAAEYDLKAVTLNKHNATGYCLPVGVDAATNTQNMSTAGVFNPKAQGEQTSLQFEPVTETSYVVYLPEVAKGTTEEDCLKIEVQLLPKNAPEGTEPEIGTFAVMNYPQNGEPEAINIIRNHWYKYTISGFAASEIQLNYQTLDWQPVNFEVGGEGFLFLNKDVIEIYNSNIDADQLKFASSSPIKSIVLKDLYTHDGNGNIVEGATDGVSAYYISKFGQKIQLGTDPGFDISDKDAALAREQVILNNITAIAEPNKLNGGITITSPFLADPTNEEVPELKQDSHYDTPRYLEFLVTNEQGQPATFRVIQYPPVVITNEEGYFSYRSDQKFDDDQEEASHYHNYMGWKSFHLTGLMWGYEFDWTNVPEKEDEDWFIGNSAKDYSSVIDNKDAVTSKAFCEVLHYGNLGAPHSFIDNRGVKYSTKYGGLYKSTTYPTDAFLRHRYYQYPGGQTTGIYKYQGYRFNSKNYDYPRGDIQGLAVGPYYERDGRTYRKQFVWNIQPIFYNLYVSKVYDKNEGGKLKGQADLNSMTYSVTMEPGITNGEWVSWGKQSYTNHRMYIIRTTTSSSDYNVGYPALMADGVTKNTVSNANMISPKFAVASQLGETRYQSIITLAAQNNYKVPVVGEFYKLAVEHCREYVETTFIDKDGDHKWDTDEEVIHYNDWRLPTKAEINAIIEYQDASRAMDRLLIGEYYFCAAGGGENADVNVKTNWVSDKVKDHASNMTGYYIRCVRDIKPNEKK